MAAGRVARPGTICDEELPFSAVLFSVVDMVGLGNLGVESFGTILMDRNSSLGGLVVESFLVDKDGEEFGSIRIV